MIRRLNLPGILFLAVLAGLWQGAAVLYHSPTFPGFATVVAYGASFPILINAIDAVRSLDPMLSHVARSLRLGRAERMRFVDLPAALPRVVAGIRRSIANALLLAVVAEMLLSTNGLAAFLVRAQESFRIDDVLAALLLIVLVALLVNLATYAIERRMLVWHHTRAGIR